MLKKISNNDQIVMIATVCLKDFFFHFFFRIFESLSIKQDAFNFIEDSFVKYFSFRINVISFDILYVDYEMMLVHSFVPQCTQTKCP